MYSKPKLVIYSTPLGTSIKRIFQKFEDDFRNIKDRTYKNAINADPKFSLTSLDYLKKYKFQSI